MNFTENFKTFTKQIDEFYEKQKGNIFSALLLLVIVNGMFAAFYVPQFLQSGVCRNYMVLNSAMHACSTFQFVRFGWNFLAFSNMFLFLPAIVLSMLMPKIYVEIKESLKEAE